MPIDVVDAVLRIVLDARRSPCSSRMAVRDRSTIRPTARSLSAAWATGSGRPSPAGCVIVGHPHQGQVGSLPGLLCFLEVLQPDVDAVLVREPGVEVRVIRIDDRLFSDGMSDVGPELVDRDRQRALRLALQDLRVLVPGVPVGVLARRDVEEVRVLAVVLDAKPGLLGRVPDEAVALVGERVAALRGVGAEKAPNSFST